MNNSQKSQDASVIEIEKPLKAKVVNRSGNVLMIPKQGMAPLLFLEWMRDARESRRKEKWKYFDIRISIHQCTHTAEEDYLHIRMENELPSTFNAACAYINSNLYL